MTTKEIIIGVLKNEIKEGRKFEFICNNYDYNIHGVFYKYILTVGKDCSLHKEIFDKEGKSRTWKWILLPIDNAEYKSL